MLTQFRRIAIIATWIAAFVPIKAHSLTIEAGTTTGVTICPKSACGNDSIFTAISKGAILSIKDLNKALGAGNVLVQTLNGNGDITVASPISWAGGDALTLSAFGNISVMATITNLPAAGVTSGVGYGTLALQADSAGTGVGTVSLIGSTDLINFSKSVASISIYYNPSDNPAGSLVNSKSYTVPTNFAQRVSTHSANQLTAYMLVNTPYDLQNIRNNLKGTYAVGNLIEASSTAGFIPIGTYTSPFLGLLDGQGQIIKDLQINSTLADVGLFGAIGTVGEVRNISLANLTISAPQGYDVGGLAGYNEGTITNSATTITTGTTTVRGNLKGTVSVGGLTGWNSGTIEGSYSRAAVGNAPAQGVYLGGLSGGNSGSIIISFADGSVTSGSLSGPYVDLGGLVGVAQSGFIAGSFAFGDITGSSSYMTVGGLVGYNSAPIVYSYATRGVVSGSSVPPAKGVSTGGLVGWNGNSVFSSYSTGFVTGQGKNVLFGGLVASNGGGTVSDSYWDTTTSGRSSSPGGGTPLATLALRSALQTGFSDAVWSIFPEHPSYPVQIPALSQLDPTFYGSLSSLAFLQRTETCTATVYAMIARSLGAVSPKSLSNSQKAFLRGATVDQFWDGYKTDRGALDLLSPNGITLGSRMSIGPSVINSLKYGPVVIVGEIGRTGGSHEQHTMLAVGLANPQGSQIVANDPWTGDQVSIDTDTWTISGIWDGNTGEFVSLQEAKNLSDDFASLPINPATGQSSLLALGSFKLTNTDPKTPAYAQPVSSW